MVLSPLMFFFSSRRRHTRSLRDWSSDVCSSDLPSARYASPTMARAGPAPIRVAARTRSHTKRDDMRSFVWVVVAIAATLTLMARAARAGDDPLPRPTYEIGHIWPLADSMYELVRLDDDVYVFASPNGEIRLTKSLGLVGVLRDEDFDEVSPGTQLTWPIKPA